MPLIGPSFLAGVAAFGVLGLGGIALYAARPRPVDPAALDDEITRRVHERTMDLDAARHRMIQILHAAGEGIYVVDRAGEVTFCNPAGLAMLGYAHEAEVFRKQAHELFHHHHEDGAPYEASLCPVSQTLASGGVTKHRGDVFWRKDGSHFPVEFTSTPIYLEEEITGAVVVFRDITRRLERERQIQESNEDLEAYASVASHDLQAPLRQIRGFAQFMSDPKATPEEREECLHAIGESAKRMQAILQSLLAYSRLGREGVKIQDVALDTVVAQALDVVKVPLAEAGGRIDVGSLPRVRGDAARLLQVFQNLIQNSIRYRHPERPLVVTVNATSNDAGHVITVEDNGQGFDAVQAERIFEMFHRLHERSDAGVGLGLAIARRSIEQHGGTLRAHGTPGNGATFTIELPREVR